MEEILEILEHNSKATADEIAVMLGLPVEEVKAAIKQYEADNVIVGYSTLVNWDKTQKEKVTALIEVKVTPQRGLGFDKIADRIYKYPEVTACYLMSGGFDLQLLLRDEP